MSELWDRFLSSGLAIVMDRRITGSDTPCRAAVEICIQAYDRWESHVKAWVVFDREGAIQQADMLDRELRTGRARGRLHGFPIGVKDIIDVEGFPTTAGASQWAEGPASSDAPMVARLRKAGAIILGKTVTTPYAWIDPPPTRNPWKLGRTPGGSSSGSAVAVATGMAFAAIGTQTGGSIIRPAAYCGVFGWKPSRESRPSTKGIVPFSKTLDTPGLLVANFLDISVLHEGFSPLSVHCDLSSTPPWYKGPLNTEAMKATLGITRHAPRLGRLRGIFEERADGEMIDALEQAVNRWQRDGCEVEEIELPPVFEYVHRAHRVVMCYEAAQVHRERFLRVPEDYPPKMSALLREGLEYTESEYREAKRVGREIEAFRPYPLDAFFMPAATGPAPLPETTGDPVFNSPWTFGGQPVVAFPIGLSVDGLPLSAQFVGTSGREDHLLAAASWCSYQSNDMGWRMPTEFLDAPQPV